MGNRTNTPDSGESIFVSKGGKDTFAGKTEESPVLTINQAITNAIATGATNINVGDGNYDEEITLGDNIDIRGVGAGLFTSGDNKTTLKTANGSVVNIAALLVSGSNSVGYLVDGKQRPQFLATAFILGTQFGSPSGSTGMRLTGVNDDVFIDINNGECRCDNATLLDIDGESPTPFSINLGTLTNFNDDLTVINHSPSDAFQISNIFVVSYTDDLDSSVTGTVFVTGDAGRLVLSGGTIDLLGKDFAIVKSGLSLSVSFNVIAGDITVNNGGQLLSTVLGLLIGNVLLETGSVSRGNIVEVDGDVTIESGASFDGVIGDVTGTVTVDLAADVNGIINGQRFGNWVIIQETLIDAFSLLDQNPTTTDAPLKITYGPAKGAASDPVRLLANGNLLINQTGQYPLEITVQYGRAGVAQTSWLLFHLTVDGVQRGRTKFAKLPNSSSDFPVQVSTVLDVVEGEVVETFITRDSQGTNSGGLLSITPTLASLNQTASAQIIVRRFL